MPSIRSHQAGFTLIEMSLVLVLLMLAVAFAADLLMETSQLFAYTAGEAVDTPVPLVIARIRGDVQQAANASCVPGLDGTLSAVVLMDFGRRIVYEKRGDALYRTVMLSTGDESRPALLWRNVSAWGCRLLGSGLLDLEVTYRRRAVPRSPLPGLPVDRGPAMEELTQKMYLLPRGAGLGDTW